MNEQKTYSGEDGQRELADINFQRYRRARDNGHTDFVKTKRRCQDFYIGEQWEKEVRAQLEAEGRPALTINKILSTVNTVLGEQREKRASFNAKVKRDSTEDNAKVVTQVLMHVAECNDLDFVESEVFQEGTISGRGYFDVRMDFDGNINGEINIKNKNSEEVLLNPDDNEYDPTSWREVISTAWNSMDEIEKLYGKKKAKEVQEIANFGHYYSNDSMVFEDQAETFGGVQAEYEDFDPAEHRDIRAIRVISRQYKKMKMCRYFVDADTGDTRQVPDGWSDRRIQFVSDAYSLRLMTRPVQAIRWTTTADHVVLHDDWSPYRTYTIVPYFCYWVAGRPFGMVQNLISPQEQLNKVSSQELHIVNSTANSGWVYEEGSITNHTDDEMAANGSKTGLILTYRKGREKPEKIQPNQIPSGIDRVAMQTASNIKEISGVSDALLGFESAEVSGVALGRKENRGQVQIQVPLDNLARTRKILGHKILELVQDFYTEHRVLFITDDAAVGQPRDKMEINTISPAGAVVNDVTVGEYDIMVTTQPARDSFRDTQFAELLEMRNAGISIPAYRVVQNSHLANKDEIAQEVRELEGLGQQTQEEQQLAQLQLQTTMQQMQLAVEKMAAEIEKIRSDAVLNTIKAEDLANSDNIEILKEDYALQKEREGNNLRQGLAQLSAISQLDRQAMSTKGKLAELRAQQQLNQPNPSQQGSNAHERKH